MTAETAHQIDVAVAFLSIGTWVAMMLLLEKSEDPRVRWARLAFSVPIHRAYERLPHAWGPLHGVFMVTAAFWLAVLLVRSSVLRQWLFVAAAGCLVFLATAWALSTGSSAGAENTSPPQSLQSGAEATRGGMRDEPGGVQRREIGEVVAASESLGCVEKVL